MTRLFTLVLCLALSGALAQEEQEALTPDQVLAFGATLRHLAEGHALAVRIDCALLPFLAGSGESSPEDMTRFAVMAPLRKE